MFPIVDHDSANDASPQELSQEEIVMQARSGDCVAFSNLFQLYNRPICTYLTRLVGNEELGRDLAQETFLRAWKSLPGLEGDLSFKPWLYRIATNTAKSHLRRTRFIQWLPWVDTEGSNTTPAFYIAGPEEHVGETEIVAKTLTYLSPQSRTCLLLQLVGGFSQHEIAQLLGISEKSVGAYVCRGREQFRQMYQCLKGANE